MPELREPLFYAVHAGYPAHVSNRIGTKTVCGLTIVGRQQFTWTETGLLKLVFCVMCNAESVWNDYARKVEPVDSHVASSNGDGDGDSTGSAPFN